MNQTTGELLGANSLKTVNNFNIRYDIKRTIIMYKAVFMNITLELT